MKKTFTVIVSQNEEDFLKFKASAGDPEFSWISHDLKLRPARALIEQDYELQRDVFYCMNPLKRTPVNIEQMFLVPNFYDIKLIIHSSVEDEYVQELAEKNDYLNPKTRVSMQMVR